jgi:hypothetical protein
MLPSSCAKVLLTICIVFISFVLADCSGRIPGAISPTFLCQTPEPNIPKIGLRFEISAGSAEMEGEHRVIYRDHPSLCCGDNSTFFADRMVVDLDKGSQDKFIEMSGNVSLVKEGFSIRSQRAFTNDPCRYIDFREDIVIRFKDGSEIRPQEIRYLFKTD